MAALNSSSIVYAEFVRLTLPTTTYTFCNAAGPIQVDGITFEGLGSLMGISEVQRNIKANSADLKISITGIDPNNVALVLGSAIKGSKLEIWRGFLDSNNQIITTPTQQFFKRYQGIVNNISIDEAFDIRARQRVATCMISSSSMRFILENRNAGMITNQKNWQTVYPVDTSMNRVAVIASTYFDFGKTPIGGGQATPVVL
jgi:hypothetical protein